MSGVEAAGVDYWMADFGQREERGRKGRFARSIEGGMEEERSQLLLLPLLYYTTAENGRKE